MKRQVGVVGHFVRGAPERFDVLDGNAGIRVLKRDGVEVRRRENPFGVETETCAGVEQRPAGDTQDGASAVHFRFVRGLIIPRQGITNGVENEIAHPLFTEGRSDILPG